MNEKTKMHEYLSIDFNPKNKQLKSPIFISGPLIDMMRAKYNKVGQSLYLELDFKLFQKETIGKTLKYVFENINEEKTTNCGDWTHYYSKLPSAGARVIVDELDLDNVPCHGTLENFNEEDGELTISTDMFCFAITKKFNEMDGFGIFSDKTGEGECWLAQEEDAKDFDTKFQNGITKDINEVYLRTYFMK